MIEFHIADTDRPTILCFGAHCDDIEIGCGGTLQAIGERYPGARLHAVVFSGPDDREAESRAALRTLGADFGSVEIEVRRFRNSYFPAEFAAIKDAVEETKQRISPDLVFTHYRNDRHQDHRVVSDLTWNAFRDHCVLEYEIPKYDGDVGQPNVFVPISSAAAERKIECILECFPSQRDRAWFRRETFAATLHLRAIECNADSGFAEAFYGRKLRLG